MALVEIVVVVVRVMVGVEEAISEEAGRVPVHVGGGDHTLEIARKLNLSDDANRHAPAKHGRFSRDDSLGALEVDNDLWTLRRVIAPDQPQSEQRRD